MEETRLAQRSFLSLCPATILGTYLLATTAGARFSRDPYLGSRVVGADQQDAVRLRHADARPGRELRIGLQQYEPASQRHHDLLRLVWTYGGAATATGSP